MTDTPTKKRHDRAFPELTLYHGTSRRSWDQAIGEAFILFVTTSEEEAQSYAYECAAGDEYDGHDPEPIVVTVTPSAVNEMAATGDIAMQPDWGWVTGVEAAARHRGDVWVEPDWKDSLSACGCACIAGFEDRFKNLVTIEAAPTVTVAAVLP